MSEPTFDNEAAERLLADFAAVAHKHGVQLVAFEWTTHEGQEKPYRCDLTEVKSVGPAQ